jgi:hypothetical protein
MVVTIPKIEKKPKMVYGCNYFYFEKISKRNIVRTLLCPLPGLT